MDFVTIALFSNDPLYCYRKGCLCSLTNFPLEQIHMKGEREVAVSEISYPSLYQKCTLVDGRQISEEKRGIKPMHS